MILKIYQTVSKTPPKGKPYSVPIFSERLVINNKVIYEPWLADGYYFWESFVDNAISWGNSHYNGNYDIYEGTYDTSDPKCFNLVDNPECITLVRDAYKTIVNQKKRKPTQLNQILYFLRKNHSFQSNFEFVRVPAEGGMRNGEELRFDNNSSSSYYLIRQTQICFWTKRSEIQNLVKYSSESPADNNDWMA